MVSKRSRSILIVLIFLESFGPSVLSCSILNDGEAINANTFTLPADGTQVREEVRAREKRSTFVRGLLDEQLGSLKDQAKEDAEILKSKVEGELNEIQTNSRSYLDGIRMALRTFACRIGLKSFCITSDVPADADNSMPSVPPFPNDEANLDLPGANATSKLPEINSTLPVTNTTTLKPAKSTEATTPAPKVAREEPILVEDKFKKTPASKVPPKDDIIVLDKLPPLQDVPNDEGITMDEMTEAPIKHNLTEPDVFPGSRTII